MDSLGSVGSLHSLAGAAPVLCTACMQDALDSLYDYCLVLPTGWEQHHVSVASLCHTCCLQADVAD